jgi:pyruvate/2-oxoglutarate dehydrogenase complex dihydrolipoamide acyltransferase (E2) component
MRSFDIRTAHKFFDITDSVVSREIRPGRTVSFMSEVDLTDVESVRARAARSGQKPCYTAFVVKAVALALREFPYANRRVLPRLLPPFSRTRLQVFTHRDISVACERNVPEAEVATCIHVIRDADRLPLAEINRQLRWLAASDETDNGFWRDYRAVVERLPRWTAAFLAWLPNVVPSVWAKWRGGAVLISSPAKYGVDAVVASWTAPLGVSFGLVKPRPVVRDGEVVVRTTFNFLLNWERRVMAGAQAARFFRRIMEILEGAETEMAPYLGPATGAASAEMASPRSSHKQVMETVSK